MNLETLLNPINFIEAKQVGVIYHFTRTYNSLLRIIKDKGLRTFRDYISFTRNYDLRNMEGGLWGMARLSFDGDTMSNKYRFTPYSHFKGRASNDFLSDEAEEKIEWEKDMTLPVFPYLIRIDILNYKESAYLIDMSFEDCKDMENLVTKELEILNIPYSIVDKWRPVR